MCFARGIAIVCSFCVLTVSAADQCTQDFQTDTIYIVGDWDDDFDSDLGDKLDSVQTKQPASAPDGVGDVLGNHRVLFVDDPARMELGGVFFVKADTQDGTLVVVVRGARGPPCMADEDCRLIVSSSGCALSVFPPQFSRRKTLLLCSPTNLIASEEPV